MLKMHHSIISVTSVGAFDIREAESMFCIRLICFAIFVVEYIQFENEVLNTEVTTEKIYVFIASIYIKHQVL